MRSYRGLAFVVLVAVVVALFFGRLPRRVLGQEPPPGTPLGSTFTYQGRLEQGETVVDGPCDFRFSLHDGPNDRVGGQVGGALALAAVEVTAGLFTVPLDFGADAFAGEVRWLQVEVSCPASATPSYVKLSPRQQLTAAPYATYARKTYSARALNDRPVSPAAPTTNQVLKWNGTAWAPGLDESGAGSLSWDSIVGKPAGFADGIDNDTLYSAGAGLSLAGTLFAVAPGGIVGSMLADRAVGQAKLAANAVDGGKIADGSVGGADVNPGEVQRRVGGSCPGGQALRAIAENGSVTCESSAGPWTRDAANGEVELANVGDRVAIGGTTAASKLDVVVAGQDGVTVRGNDTGDARLQISNGGGSHYVFDDDDGGHALKLESAPSRDMAFNVGGATEALRITAGRNVGVGTAAPGGRLHVASAGAINAPQLQLEETAVGGCSRLRLQTWTQATGSPFKDKFWDIASGCGSGNALAFYLDGTGDLMLLSSTGDMLTMLNGAKLTAGGTWTNASDRNLKAAFESVDAQQVLGAVARLPLGTWSYKAEPASVRHIGPTAQDFAAAFGVGADDRHIATVDADGVALSAIQGLHQLVQRQQAEIATLQAARARQAERLADLETRVAAMEQALRGGTAIRERAAAAAPAEQGQDSH